MKAQTPVAPLRPAPLVLPGTWKLAAGRALTLQPAQHGALRVAHGCLWLTFDGPHAGPLNDLGDRFVEVGDTVRIAPGERVVIEPWRRGTAAYFTWDPAPAPQRVRSIRAADMVQPLADLRAAMLLGAGAAVRIVIVLLRLAAATVLPRRPQPAPGGFAR